MKKKRDYIAWLLTPLTLTALGITYLMLRLPYLRTRKPGQSFSDWLTD